MLGSRTLLNTSKPSAYAALLCALLSGCAAGPDYQRPAAPTASSYTVQQPSEQMGGQRLVESLDIPYDWWTIFQSPQLNALVERALKDNPGIEAAQAALRQAQENVVAQRGFFFPTVSVNYSPSRNKVAGNMGGNSPGLQENGDNIVSSPTAPAYYNFHTAQLSIGYVPDVFGINRRLTESAVAQAEWQQMQLQAAQLTLVSNMVAAAIQEAALRAQIAAVENVISINRENLEIVRQQLKLGFVSELDVATQETQMAQSEQVLPPLRKQLAQTRDLIRALAGNVPSENILETFELADLRLPSDLPLTLPSRLVEQRPDVRAAEAQLHSASAQYGVAVANRMPQFMVTADVGGMASSPEWMFRSGGTFFNLTGNISQIIFDGGTLRARSRAAEQALIQAGAIYRSTVIAALQNVADTLHAIRADAEAFTAADAAAQASLTALKLTRKQFQLGYASYQDLLAAQQNFQLAGISLAQAQGARLADTAALYQALGGGWWNREGKTAAEDQSGATQIAASGAQPQ